MTLHVQGANVKEKVRVDRETRNLIEKRIRWMNIKGEKEDENKQLIGYLLIIFTIHTLRQERRL